MSVTFRALPSRPPLAASIDRAQIQGNQGISKVIFGRAGDASLLGVLTLEVLGLSLDPLKRTLRPLKLMIA